MDSLITIKVYGSGYNPSLAQNLGVARYTFLAAAISREAPCSHKLHILFPAACQTNNNQAILLPQDKQECENRTELKSIKIHIHRSFYEANKER